MRLFFFPPGPKSPGKMGMVNFRKGDPNFFRLRPFRRGRYFEKVSYSYLIPQIVFWKTLLSHDIQWLSAWYFLQPFVNMNLQRRPKSLIPPEEVWNYRVTASSWVFYFYFWSLYNLIANILPSSSYSVWDDKGQTATFYKQRRKHPALWEDEGAEDAWTDGAHGACPKSLRAATVLYKTELSWYKLQMVCLLFKTALMMTLCLFFSPLKTARNCRTWTSWACPYNARARRTGEPATGATETGDGETKTGAGAFGEGEAGEGESPYRAGAVSQQIIMSVKPIMSKIRLTALFRGS